MGHKESVADTARVLGRYYDGIEYRGKAQADVEALAQHSGVPVFNGLTDEWHPTQMLADFLTMHEASGKEYRGLSYAFMGDLRFNMGRSLLVMGALMGSDVRLVGPKELAPPADVVDDRQGHRGQPPARASPSPTTLPRASRAWTSSTPTCGSPWASPRRSGRIASSSSRPYQVNAGLMTKSGNPDVKFMHCLPAFHDANTVVGKEMMEATGMPDGPGGHDEVFESTASIVFDQAENRMHTIKAVMVASLGS